MPNLTPSRTKQWFTVPMQAGVVLVGLAAFAFLIWEPLVEGVNAHATLVETYVSFFVAYVYVGSLPFFAGLYHAFQFLGYAGRNEFSSPLALQALRRLRLCFLAAIGVVVVSVLFMIGGDREDRPAGLFLRLLVGVPLVVIVVAAAKIERSLPPA